MYQDLGCETVFSVCRAQFICAKVRHAASQA
jgi:hypothetical protein